jgi:methyl-accepting chemotaxis protein
MSNDSLLSIETARKRLEKLDEERKGLSELILKLKDIRDTMTSLQAENENMKGDIEKWLIGFKSLAAEIKSKSEEANKQLAESIQSFESRSENLLSSVSSSSEEMLKRSADLERNSRDRLNAMEEELMSKFEKEFRDFEKNFQVFRDEHIASLERVSKSYDRMHAEYTSIRDGFHTLEDAIESTERDSKKIVIWIKNQFESLKQNVESTEKSLRDQIKKTVEAGYRQIEAILEDRLGEVSRRADELSTELNAEKVVTRRTTRFLWIGIVFGVLLGGSSLAFLLFHQFFK